MKATGIVRRIDELGRVVIPKEIRRTQRIRRGDPLEIFTTGEVGVSKHEPTIYLLAAQALGSAPGETTVFEDSLYALKTAKAAGFYTVGVYDADGESDQAGLKAAADLYVKELGEAAGRW